MVLKTKFDIGQEVWFRRGDQMVIGQVFSIEVKAHRILGTSVRYVVQYDEYNGIMLKEDQVYGDRG